MKKTLFLSIILAFFYSGCFSVPNINPFSKEEKKVEKKEIQIPKDAPSWVFEAKMPGYITQLGVATNIDKKEFDFHRKKALINASHKLTKKIYVRTLKLYKDYEEEKEKASTYDKDIKKFSEHISLKSLTHSRIKNIWVSKDNQLFIQIAVESDIVTKQIQNTSKLLFDVDQDLYRAFLSNRAQKDINKILEE